MFIEKKSLFCERRQALSMTLMPKPMRKINGARCPKCARWVEGGPGLYYNDEATGKTYILVRVIEHTIAYCEKIPSEARGSGQSHTQHGQESAQRDRRTSPFLCAGHLGPVSTTRSPSSAVAESAVAPPSLFLLCRLKHPPRVREFSRRSLRRSSAEW